uniref:PWWP domain-containing protein n=1 Tax=Plectus sambesii TaxID=2011161 RepID=A0A914XPT9_9BILA
MKKTTTPTTPIGSASSTRRATRNASAAVAEEQSSASQPAVDGPSKDNLSAKLPAEENEWNVLADASVSEPAVAASVPSREDTQLPIRKRRAVTRADGIHEEEAKKQKRSAAKKPKQPKRAAKRSAEGVEVDAEQGTSSGRVSNATDHSDEFVSIEKELKELRSKSGTPNTDYHLAVGDVAWAKYGRWPQWPVLVTGYNRKRREYSYVFLPIKSLPFKEPKHKFRAKKLERFSDKYFDLYNPSDVELAQAVTQAKDIQQGKLDPFSKLAESRDSRQVRREAKANGNAEAAGAIDSFPRRESMQTPEPDEAESSVQDSDTPPSTSSCATPPPTVLSDDTRLKIAKRRARNEPLVEYALSDECKQHLLAVVRQQVDCPRDAAWRAAKSSKLKMSTVEANAGPICDDDQIERLVDRLLEWLETEMNSSPDASRLPRTARFSYVVSVWLPEAVKFAMQAVWSCSAEVAEETLNKPKEFLEEELLEVRQQMNDVRDVVGMSSNSPFEQLVAAACLTRSNEFVD